ncbi:MAG: hypothetical protein IT197_09305 [Acidimicrobiia bacterium]|nr:hypothetical protein [Acidimicrobiia bacterium]
MSVPPTDARVSAPTGVPGDRASASTGVEPAATIVRGPAEGLDAEPFRERPAGRPGSRGLAAALVVLGVALAANSLLGPLGLGVIEYHYAESMTNQGIGLDAVALALGAPLAGLAAVLVHRGHRAGPIVAFAPATFAAYMMPQYVVGPDYLGLPGNNERAIPFHISVMVLALGIAVAAWRTAGHGGLPPDSRRSDRRRAWVLVGLVVFVAAGRWLPAFAGVIRDRPSSAYLDNPTAFWLVGLLDMGLIVPAAIATAAGLRRGLGWARRAGYAVIGWFSLVPASVAAMAVTMQVNGDPLATTSETVVTVVAALAFTAGAAALYRPLFAPVD